MELIDEGVDWMEQRRWDREESTSLADGGSWRWTKTMSGFHHHFLRSRVEVDRLNTTIYDTMSVVDEDALPRIERRDQSKKAMLLVERDQ